MLVTRADKTELDLNYAQITTCRKHAGAARWAYNWGQWHWIALRGTRR